jgi:S1-C subfamily serine protease
MRMAFRSAAVAALLAVVLAQLQAREPKQDDEAKGKIPETARKIIAESKIRHGVVVVEVTAGGPATSGREKPKGEGDVIILEPGDIITHVDGKEIKTSADYHKLMSGNDEKKITVIDVNTGKPIVDYFKPQDGRLLITFEVITPPLG